MRKQSKGFTLIELMIVLAVVGIVLVLGVNVVAGFISRGDEAREAAITWTTEMGMDTSAVSCADRDTDGDGYVSCNVAQKRSDGTVAVTPIECAVGWTMNSGCRTPKAVIHQ